MTGRRDPCNRTCWALPVTVGVYNYSDLTHLDGRWAEAGDDWGCHPAFRVDNSIQQSETATTSRQAIVECQVLIHKAFP